MRARSDRLCVGLGRALVSWGRDAHGVHTAGGLSLIALREAFFFCSPTHHTPPRRETLKPLLPTHVCVAGTLPHDLGWARADFPIVGDMCMCLDRGACLNQDIDRPWKPFQFPSLGSPPIARIQAIKNTRTLPQLALFFEATREGVGGLGWMFRFSHPSSRFPFPDPKAADDTSDLSTNTNQIQWPPP